MLFVLNNFMNKRLKVKSNERKSALLLLTLKSVWESHVTWGTPVQRFVFLGLLVLELEPMYATSDRQTDGGTDGRRTPITA